jgi:hypothetical protein
MTLGYKKYLVAIHTKLATRALPQNPSSLRRMLNRKTLRGIAFEGHVFKTLCQARITDGSRNCPSWESQFNLYSLCISKLVNLTCTACAFLNYDSTLSVMYIYVRYICR